MAKHINSNSTNFFIGAVFALLFCLPAHTSALEDKLGTEKRQSIASKTKKDINIKAFKLCEEAVKAANNKDYEAALAYLKQALVIEPKFPDALFNIGSIYRVMGRYEDSYSVFHQLLQANPNDNEARLEKVLTLISMNSYDAAKTEFDKIEEAKDTNAKTRYALVAKRLSKLKNKTTEEITNSENNRANTKRSGFSKQISNKITSPTGIAKDVQQNLYVANFSENTIEQYSSDGKHQKTFAQGDMLVGPSDLAFDNSTKNLLVSNYKSGTVIAIDETGKMKVILDNLEKPYGLLLDETGMLYVSEQGKKSVTVLQVHN
jgi:tetratricopeptide (TPR) repeat protein